MSRTTDAPKTTNAAKTADASKTTMQRVLDIVEKVGNKVPHPALIFLILIAAVVLLSEVCFSLGVSASLQKEKPSAGYNIPPVAEGDDWPYQLIAADQYEIGSETIAVRSLLQTDGLRFMYTSLIPSFMGFTALGLLIVAMTGVGVAEESGLIKALIRKLVMVSPPWALSYILVFVGIVSSVASDAGYLVLIPLAGGAFLSIGRHPLAGLALGFAAVASAFTVNMLIKPLDAVLVEFTNDAIHLVDPKASIGLTSNLWFSIASVFFLTLVVGLITEKLIEPRLGKYEGQGPAPEGKPAKQEAASADESRGLWWAAAGLVAVLVVFGLLALPRGAPLRHPETGDLIGSSPFMGGLIAIIMSLFLITGVAYGVGAKTLHSATDVIKSIEKALSGMGGLIFLFLIISQFVAYFNYSNMGTILAVKLSDALRTANFPPLLLLIGFIFVVAIVDLLITGAIAKWALFAPIFVPLMMNLGVAPEAVLAAYRVADSPLNSITPLNAYFALMVGFAQKYDSKAGVGTIVSLMLPYVIIMFVLWTLLFVVWHSLGLPWGL